MDETLDGQLALKLSLLKNQAQNSGEQQLDLMEHLLLLMVRWQLFQEVVKEGQQTLLFTGNRPRVYKCIIVGLCRTGRYEECYQLLEQWKKAGPKDPIMLECKQKVEGVLSALRTGVDPMHVLRNLEQAIGLWPNYEHDEKCEALMLTPISQQTLIRPSPLVPAQPYPLQQHYHPLRSLSPIAKPYSPMSSHFTNPPYLSRLIKRVNSATNLAPVLVNEIEGVRIKCFGDLEVKLNVTEHRWVFAIASREALRTVCLLNDGNRENFCITGGYFYYDRRNPLNFLILHPTNGTAHLQVLNTFVPLDCLLNFGGWPSSFCYKLEISFKCLLPGTFKQAVVFDFKKEPRVVRYISAEMLDQTESDSGSSSPDSLIQLWKELEAIQPSELKAMQGDSSISHNTLDSKSHIFLLNKSNYVISMGKMLNQEMHFLQTKLREQSLIRTMNLTKSYSVEKKFGSEIHVSREGERFLVMEIGSTICEGTIWAKLVTQQCNTVLVTHLKNLKQSFTCIVKEKFPTNWVISLDYTQVQELNLQLDIPYQFKIEFILDILHYEESNKLLGSIGDIELQILFPDVARKITSETETFNGVLQEGLCTLNPRQADAYNVITKIQMSMAYVPPILLIAPAGSGKTYALTESIKKILISQPNSRILICTISNSAANRFIDTVDEWIKCGLPIRVIRLYDPETIVSEDVPTVVKQYCTFTLDYTLRLPQKEEIQQVNIVITTANTTKLLGRADRLNLGKYYFSHIIVDEAGEAAEIDLIAPLLLANPNTRIVFSGDHLQESFSYLSSMNSNMLERLNLHYPNGHPCKILLTENYQSHAEILKFASTHFFPVKLRCTSIQPTHPNYFPLSYFYVKGEEVKTVTSFYNLAEISEICKALQNLILTWPKQWGKYQEPGAIIVLTAYEDQAVRLRNQLRIMGLGFVSVEGIWNLKGNQYRVVMLSAVRTFKGNNPCVSVSDGGFFTNSKLIYTALTRAQSLFAVFGDPVSLTTCGNCRNIWNAFINAAGANDSVYGLQQQHDRLPASFGPFDVGKDFLDQHKYQNMNESTIGIGMGNPEPIQVAPLFSNLEESRQQFSFSKSEEFTSKYAHQGIIPAVSNNIPTQICATQFTTQKNVYVNGNLTQACVNGKQQSIESIPHQQLAYNSNIIPILIPNGGTSKEITVRSNGETPLINNISNKAFQCTEKRNISDQLKYGDLISTTSTNQQNGFSVAHKLENLTPFLQQTVASEDKESTADEWVEVKKTKKSKQNNNLNTLSNFNCPMPTSVEKTTDDKIKLLISLGYDKRRSIKALQYSNKDLDKAVDYLLAGQFKSANISGFGD